MDKLIVGIPACDERDWLPQTLDALERQSHPNFEVWICVNHSRERLLDPKNRTVRENRELLAWLKQQSFSFSLRVIDATSQETAPPIKSAGVGWARRRIFDMALSETIKPATICVSLDADTHIEPDYLRTVAEAFERYPNAVGLAAPYYHPLPKEPKRALRLLRYEIYMRYYQLNMWRIGSPYAYLALGSAIAFRASAYARANRFPLRTAGEDFYFLQQLRKTGPLIRWIDSCVSPASRPSDRVPYGTGILLDHTNPQPLEERFPFYHPKLFDRIGMSYNKFPDLYDGPCALPIDEFLNEKLNGVTAYNNIRNTVPNRTQFVKAYHERLDALRCLQCLKFYQERELELAGISDGEKMNQTLTYFGAAPTDMLFEEARLAQLNDLRDQLFALESTCQQNFMNAWDLNSRW